MLKVQEFLKDHSLQELTSCYDIECKIDEDIGVVLLKYSISSDLKLDICRECRALILELDTYNIVCKTFNKFFNFDEPDALLDKSNFDWNSVVVEEKIDGSLIQLYFYKGEWRISTTGNASAFNAPINNKDITFGDLFINTLRDMGVSFEQLVSNLNTNCYYAFELATPDNIVVVPHDKPTITLLAVFQNNNGTIEEIDKSNIQICVPFVQIYSGLKSIEYIKKVANSRNANKAEGFVIRDKAFNRFKIKSEQYVQAHKFSGELSFKSLLEIAMGANCDDIISILPHNKVQQLLDMKFNIQKLKNIAQDTYEKYQSIEDQKTFALNVVSYPFSMILFNLRKGMDINSAINKVTLEKLASVLEKTLFS